jgi:methionine sulfoxide reductase heme-binding subunit
VTRKTRQNLLRWAGHAGALAPLLLLAWDGYAGQLSADPVREVTLRTGKAALVLLTLSLAITPLKIWLGWTLLHPLRRILGLYAFLYVALHLLIFVYLDYGLNPRLLREALFEKPYALVGLAAFLILLPLAATSSRWAMRRMGKDWTRLHRWVYLATVLAVLHYFLLVKNTYTQPFIFAVILGVLLASRWDPLKQRILRGRRRWERQWNARAAPTKAPGE